MGLYDYSVSAFTYTDNIVYDRHWYCLYWLHVDLLTTMSVRVTGTSCAYSTYTSTKISVHHSHCYRFYWLLLHFFWLYNPPQPLLLPVQTPVHFKWPKRSPYPLVLPELTLLLLRMISTTAIVTVCTKSSYTSTDNWAIKAITTAWTCSTYTCNKNTVQDSHRFFLDEMLSAYNTVRYSSKALSVLMPLTFLLTIMSTILHMHLLTPYTLLQTILSTTTFGIGCITRFALLITLSITALNTVSTNSTCTTTYNIVIHSHCC